MPLPPLFRVARQRAPQTYRPLVEELEDRCLLDHTPLLFVVGTANSFPIPGQEVNFAYHLGLPPNDLMAVAPEEFAPIFTSIQNQGYVLGQDFFVVTYDWREAPAPSDNLHDGHIPGLTAQSITSGTFRYCVDYLGYALDQAVQSWQSRHSGASLAKVDVIAFSLGNNVTRSYIQSDAYGGTYTAANGQVRQLPRINNFIMAGAPTQGSVEIWNLFNDNFNLNPFDQFLAQSLLAPVYQSVSSGTGVVTSPTSSITRQTITNPTTGQPDSQLFLQQYFQGVAASIPTFNFLDLGGGSLTNVNSLPGLHSDVLLDLNGGPDPNSFASLVGHVTVAAGTNDTSYAYSANTGLQGTGTAVSDKRRVGLGGFVFSIENPTPVPTVAGQVWYQEQTAVSGDGEIALQSLIGQFQGDPRIQVFPFTQGVNTSGSVLHGGLLSNPDFINLVLGQLQAYPAILLPIIATGANAGGGPQVNVYNAYTGTLQSSFYAFVPGFTGGVRVAVADVNHDGVLDIIVGAGPGGGPQVTLFDGKTLQPIFSFFAFAPSFTGGVFVAAGDVNNDGYADIIVGAGAGGGPQVKVFSGKDGSLLRSFNAFDPSFSGGVRVAAGDINGDGFADVICGAGPGGGPQVTVFSGKNGSTLTSFFALPASFTGGVYVAAGDLNGDGLADIIVGAGAGGGPQVTIYSGKDSSVLARFFALPPTFTGGVVVGFSAAFGSNGQPALLTAAGPGGGPLASSFDSATLQVLGSFFAYNPQFTGGAFVAGN